MGTSEVRFGKAGDVRRGLLDKWCAAPFGRRGLLGLLLVGALSACGSSGGASHTLTGHVTVVGSGGAIHYQTDAASLRGAPVDHAPVGSPCEARQGFSDIAQGADVVVKDANGKIIATGHIGSGALAEANQVPEITPAKCAFPVTVPNVPASSFYTFTVANRGDVHYTAADLKNAGWDVELTLGSP